MKQYSLYKPGAEKLLEVYGYACFYEVVTKRVLMPEDPLNPFRPHGPYFEWDIIAHVYSKRSGNELGQGVGSCNSMETKYRYRDGKRKCPACGEEALMYGKPEYGKGEFKGVKHWLCYARNGGCGESFKVNEPKIVDQEVGKIPNPDMWDIMNTIEKMAAKRAIVHAAISLTRSGGLFVPEDDAGDSDHRGAATTTRTTPETVDPYPVKFKAWGKNVATKGVTKPTFEALADASKAYDKQHGSGATKKVLKERFNLTTSVDLSEDQGRRLLKLITEGDEPKSDADEGNGNDEGGDPLDAETKKELDEMFPD